MQIQFDSPKAQFKCSSPESLKVGQSSMCDSIKSDMIPGITVLNDENLNDLPWYINLIALIAFGIIARLIAYYSLRKNSRIVKN